MDRAPLQLRAILAAAAATVAAIAVGLALPTPQNNAGPYPNLPTLEAGHS